MTTELTLMGAKNRATQIYFVFLENCDRNQIKLINPDGKILTVPQHIFESPVSLRSTDFATSFTPKQLEAAEKFIRTGGKEKAPKRKTTTTRKSAAKTVTKTGLGITWSAPNLTFYKFKIDPLGPKQSFRIDLESGEQFQISKEEFQSVFSDILLSHEYSREGIFSFADMPDRAKKFLTQST